MKNKMLITLLLLGGLVRTVNAQYMISTYAGGKGPGYSGDGNSAKSAKLQGPAGLELDGTGNLYIADAFNHCVRMVNSATGVISTIAGDGTKGYSGDGSAATSARLSSPVDIAIDTSGNLYIVDAGNSRIRKINAATGVITTVAGKDTAGYSGDGGPATSAKLNPSAIAVDIAGNLYIADNISRIRKVDAATGIISTFAGNGKYGYAGDGGPATSASLFFPSGVSVDTSGNVYIADQGNNRIRKIEASSAVITTVAGNGTTTSGGDGEDATSAGINGPGDIALDIAGNLYIAEANGNRIRKVDAATGIITTIAGTGKAGSSGDGGNATSAKLNTPLALTVDTSGKVYVSDTFNDRIRLLQKATQNTFGVSHDRRFEAYAYPNPFYGEVALHFNTIVNEQVTIEVIDLTGRVVAIPLKDKLTKTGEQRVILNPGSFSGQGAYLVKILAGNNLGIVKIEFKGN